MDVVKNQLAKVQQQLAGLTPSQKMLTGALVAIMVMTLLFWGRQAGTAEMEPVLDQALAKEDVGRIRARLKAIGIDAKVENDRVMVPAGRVYEALADLAYADALPENSVAGFDQMAAKLSPWASQSERATHENRAKEITCAQIIGRFPGVQEAHVLIDPTSKRHIGRPDIEPSATVNITMKGGENARKVAEAAASVVSGAQASLPAARINVVVNGTPQRLRAAAEANGLSMGDDQLDLMLKHQQRYENNIHATLSYVEGLRVAVSVKLSRANVRKREHVVDEDRSFSKVASEDEEETTTTAPDPLGGEPGANPNLGGSNIPMEVPPQGGAGGGGGGGVESNKRKTESKDYITFTETHTEHGPGEPTVTSASVRVPRGYFVTVLKQNEPATTPGQDAVTALSTRLMKEMEDGVRAATGLGPDTHVSVAAFDDVVLMAPVAAGPTATASIPLVLGSHSKEIALSGLALVSLFMVSMFVRRPAASPGGVAGTPAGAIATALAGGPLQLSAGEALAGEAGAGRAALDGMELDEEAVRTQQMLDQVSTLVSDNPDAAASLVKRWLNRD